MNFLVFLLKTKKRKKNEVQVGGQNSSLSNIKSLLPADGRGGDQLRVARQDHPRPADHVAGHQRRLLARGQLLGVLHLARGPHALLRLRRHDGLRREPLGARLAGVGVGKSRQVQAGLLGHDREALLLDRLDRARADAQPHPPALLGPEEALHLEVGLLELLVALVGEGDDVAVVGLGARELADAAGG